MSLPLCAIEGSSQLLGKHPDEEDGLVQCFCGLQGVDRVSDRERVSE